MRKTFQKRDGWRLSFGVLSFIVFFALQISGQSPNDEKIKTAQKLYTEAEKLSETNELEVLQDALKTY